MKMQKCNEFQPWHLITNVGSLKRLSPLASFQNGATLGDKKEEEKRWWRGIKARFSLLMITALACYQKHQVNCSLIRLMQNYHKGISVAVAPFSLDV